MADGEYYAGSRPPLGSDKGLRVLHARRADQRVMHIYRVDDAARRTTLVSKANSDFDKATAKMDNNQKLALWGGYTTNTFLAKKAPLALIFS